MADSLINIVIRAQLDIASSITEAQAQLNSLRNSLNTGTNASQASGNLDTLNDALDDTQNHLHGAEQGLQDLQGGLNNIRDAVPNAISLIKGLAASLLGLVVFDYLKNATQIAARAEVLGTVLHVVGENAGYTTEQLDRADKGVQKMGITATASRQAITQFIQAGLDLNKVTTLARAAQDLAVVAGENSSETFSRLITNIQQLDTMGLRFMGLIVNTDLAFQAYADSVDKTATSLSQAERQQAFMNAALTESLKLAGTYEASLNNAGKQAQSLDRYQQQLAKGVGDLLLPSYLALIQEYTKFLKESELVTEDMNNQTSTAIDLGAAVKDLAATLREAGVFLVQHHEAIGTVIEGYLAFAIGARVIGTVSAAWVALRGVVAGYGLTVAAAGAATEGASAAFIAARVAGAAFFGAIASPAALAVGTIAASAYAAHWVINLLNIGGAADKAKAKLDKLNIDVREADSKRFVETLQNRIELLNQQATLEGQLRQAESSGDSDSIIAVEKEITALKTKHEANEKIARSLQDSLGYSWEQVEVVQADLEASKALVRVKNDDVAVQKEVVDALKKTGIEAETVGGVVLALSPEFKVLQGTVNLVAKEIRHSLDIDKPASEWVTNIRQMDLALLKMAEGAKTPDAIIAALDTLNGTMDISSSLSKSLRENLTFNFDASVLKELDDATAGLTSRQGELITSLTLMKSIKADDENASRSLAQSILDVGGSATEAVNGVMALKDSLANLGGQSISFGSAISTQELYQKVNEANALYTQDANNLSAVSEQKKQIILGYHEDVLVEQAKLDVLEKQSVGKRIEITKTFYDAVKTGLEETQQLYVKYYQALNGLKEEERTAAKTQEEYLVESKRQGMSAIAVIEDKEKESRHLRYQIDAERQKGNYDLAKELATKRVSLEQDIAKAKSNGGEIDNHKEIQAYEQLQGIIKKQEKDAEVGVQSQIKNYADLRSKLKDVGDELGALTKKQLSIQVKIDVPSLSKSWSDAVESTAKSLKPLEVKALVSTDSIDNMVVQVKQALENIKATVQVNAQTVQGRAAGGFISGPGTGTSDSILSWLSNGEFVMRADAVRAYGVNFMHSLNSISMPRHGLPSFSGGGSVGSSPQQATRDIVDINFNVGGDRVRLSGDRNQVKKMVAAMNKVSRSSI